MGVRDACHYEIGDVALAGRQGCIDPAHSIPLIAGIGVVRECGRRIDRRADGLRSIPRCDHELGVADSAIGIDQEAKARERAAGRVENLATPKLFLLEKVVL